MTTNTQRRANLLFALLFVLKKIRKMLWLRTGNRKVKAMKKENNMIELIGVTKQFGDRRSHPQQHCQDLSGSLVYQRQEGLRP